MIISFYNTSYKNIRLYFYNTNKVFVIKPLEKQVFTIDDEEIQFEVSANDSSKYAKLFKTTEFQVSSKYFLLNKFDRVDIEIVKQEVEDISFNKFIRFVCHDDTPFAKIEYNIVDSKDIKKKEQKNILLYYFMLFLSHFFSKVNVMFAAIGIAIGGYFGTRYGIVCYLVIFVLYFIVIYFIDLNNDKHLAVDKLMTHDYISTLFSNNIVDDCNH